jgi:Icc-related predicted phosphoesterase
MRIIAISDTHNRYPRIPEGDILIHAGDLTGLGTRKECDDAMAWLASLPHKHKLFIPGNHDFAFEREVLPVPDGLVLLNNKTVEVEGITICGSPYSLEFRGWAFGSTRDLYRARKMWERIIPDNLDILVTHGPAFEVLDRTYHGEPAGDEALAWVIASKQPKAHVFGHIHESYGNVLVDGVQRYNVAMGYDLEHPPTIIDFEK